MLAGILSPSTILRSCFCLLLVSPTVVSFCPLFGILTTKTASSPARIVLAGSRTTAPSPTILWMNKSKSKKSSPSKKKSSSGGGSKGFGAAAVTAGRDQFPYAGSVLPGKQSPQRKVIVQGDINSKIIFPDYAVDGRPKKGSSMPLLPWVIEVKTPKEIEKMIKSGKLARQILDLAGRAVKIGVTTDEIDTIVHEAILDAGAYPCKIILLIHHIPFQKRRRKAKQSYYVYYIDYNKFQSEGKGGKKPKKIILFREYVSDIIEI